MATSEQRRQWATRWRLSHPDKVKARQDRWRAKNKAKLVAYQVEYNRQRFDTDPLFRVATNLRKRIRDAIKRGIKSDKTMNLLGCSLEELKRHIENLWQPGMSWENYGMYGWHIDHVKPCAVFDLSDPEQQRACFHWSNLQPLWAGDNIRKSDSVKEKTPRNRGGLDLLASTM
jgi:hypothetical protein